MAKVNPNKRNEKISDIFPGQKVINYLNDFFNWHLSISLPKWAQTNKMNQNQTRHLQIWQHFSLFAKCHAIWMTFKLYLLKSFILSGHYTNPFNWIRFLEINKLCNVIAKIWYFQKIESWFQLVEKFEHIQTFQLIQKENEWIALGMEGKTW